MNLDDVRIFAATLDAGSFTAAAERLQLSKQFVSRRMAALEAALGVRLLVRNTRKLAVTELGREFHAHALRILAEVDEAEQAMSLRRHELHGTIKLSMPMSFGLIHLSGLVAEFLAQHAAVRFLVELDDRRTDLIGEGFDLALRIGPLADSTLIARGLGWYGMVSCCSPAYLERHGAPATPADLFDHACLLHGRENLRGWEFMVDGHSSAFDVQGPLVANNGSMICDAAVAGLGIALLPRFIVAPALAAGQLVPILEPYAPPPLPLHAVYPRHRQGAATLHAFLGFLEERLAPLADAGRGLVLNA